MFLPLALSLHPMIMILASKIEVFILFVAIEKSKQSIKQRRDVRLRHNIEIFSIVFGVIWRGFSPLRHNFSLLTTGKKMVWGKIETHKMLYKTNYLKVYVAMLLPFTDVQHVENLSAFLIMASKLHDFSLQLNVVLCVYVLTRAFPGQKMARIEIEV